MTDPIAKHGRPSDAAIREAGEVYGAILADPERADQIRAARAAAAQTSGQQLPQGAAAGRNSTRKSA